MQTLKAVSQLFFFGTEVRYMCISIRNPRGFSGFSIPTIEQSSRNLLVARKTWILSEEGRFDSSIKNIVPRVWIELMIKSSSADPETMLKQQTQF